MAITDVSPRAQAVEELDKIPSEYLPALVKMMRAFRDGIMLPPAEESFRQGWEEARSGQTRPIAELWSDIDAE